MRPKKIFCGSFYIMKANRLWIIAVLLSLLATTIQAQQGKTDIKQHEQEVKDMVAFLEYVLNTIGSSGTSARDKDMLITESYTKIFRDAKVQIEDDLVEKRNVITNKDVQAYLKDVDFFFEDVKFEFTIKGIQGKVTSNDKLFYKVSLLRNIKGVTSDGKTVNNTVPRYIEINYDPKDQDLKIVSIYTNEFDEKVALLNWWSSLSYEWQSIFKKRINLTTDSVQLNDIKNIVSIDALDLSKQDTIQRIDPLAELINLQVLNLANTAVGDLSPLRNLTDLVELNLSNTKISDISALKYSDKLVKFNISNTAVSDISVLEKMTKLETLELSKTQVIDFYALGYLVELKYLNLEGSKILSLSPIEKLGKIATLNVSGTLIDNLTPIASHKNIKALNLDSTRVNDITPLKGLASLEVLHINQTTVSNLRPLQNLGHLERIYCDHTPINQSIADAFMASNPGVLVIYDSEDLKGWWETLAAGWRDVLSKAAKIQLNPTKEELAKVTNLDSINFTGNAAIQDIEALRKLQKLQVVNASKTVLKDISPLEEHKEIRILDISDTNVGDISILSQFSKLKELRADRTDILDLEPLAALPLIQKIYADETAINNFLVEEFLKKRPGCLVIFKSSVLDTWWTGLPEAWKDVFQKQVTVREDSKKEDLHKLIELETLRFKDAEVNDLSPLDAFVRLKELDFSGTAVSDLSPLSTIKSLTSLHATNSPIRELAPLSVMSTLVELDISNTPVVELKPIRTLQNLRKLNCSGTQVSSLSALEELTLEFVDCSNTGVKSIDVVFGMPLTTLKCYNTRVSSKSIEKFKSSNPKCNVVYYR